MPPVTPRFTVRAVEHSEACTVIDNDAREYNMTPHAISLRVRRVAADKIAHILNVEWRAFLRDPNN